MKRNFTVRQGALDGLKAFLSVAQHRSFRKAAAELGLTPSAISQGRLVLAPFAPTTPGVFLYYPGHRQIMLKLRAFVDHAKGHSRAARLVAAKSA